MPVCKQLVLTVRPRLCCRPKTWETKGKAKHPSPCWRRLAADARKRAQSAARRSLQRQYHILLACCCCKLSGSAPRFVARNPKPALGLQRSLLLVNCVSSSPFVMLTGAAFVPALPAASGRSLQPSGAPGLRARQLRRCAGAPRRSPASQRAVVGTGAAAAIASNGASNGAASNGADSGLRDMCEGA